MNKIYYLLGLFFLTNFALQAQCDKVPLPYTENFETTNLGQIPNCTTTQNLGNGNVWDVRNNKGDRMLTYTYNTSHSANVWFFTRKFELEAGKEYTVSYDYASADDYPENMKVAIGKNNKANAMTQELANHPNILNKTLENNKVTFTVSETTEYYLGFLAYSEADQYYLYLDNISLVEGDGQVKCDPVTEFSYEFEDFTKFPDKCWKSNASEPKVSIKKNKGSKTIQIYAFGPQYNEDIYFVSPEVSNLDGSHVFSFDVRESLIYQKNMKAQFGVLKENDNYDSFMAIGDEFELTQDTNYTSEPISAPAGYKYLVVKVMPNEQYQTVYLDNMVWKANPNPCVPVALPYTEDFNGVDVGNLPNCTTTENAGQGNDWSVQEDEQEKVLRYEAHASEAANAWFFTQGLNLTQGEKYTLFFDYKAKTETSIEKLKVAFGEDKTAVAMTNDLADYTEINNVDFKTAKITFTAPETKTYYIGLNAYSEANQLWLTVDNIQVIHASISVKVKDDADATITEKNGQLQLQASITPATANQDVTWSIVKGNSFVSIDNNGMVTAKENGVATLRATSVENTMLYDEIDVTVNIVCPILDLPYKEDFNSVDVGNIPDCSATENAGQGNDWSVKEDGQEKVLRYEAHASEAANAWFFTQGLNLTQGEKYTLFFDYKAKEETSKEELKVAFGEGQTATDMTNDLVDYTEINNVDFKTAKITFTAPETKTYYIGLNAHSEANQQWLTIDNIQVIHGAVSVHVKDNADAKIIKENGQLQLQVSVTPATASQEVTWSITKGDNCVNVDNDGMVTAKENGVAMVRATSVENPLLYDEMEITVDIACPSVALPYSEDFTGVAEGSLPECTTVVNKAGNGDNWIVKDFFGNMILRYGYSSEKANSWFFTKGLQLKKGDYYVLSYEYMAKTLQFTEKMKVAIGKENTVEAMTQQLADHPNIVNTAFEENTVRFTVTETGTYYIGFQAYSDPNQFWLSLDNINVKESPIYVEVENGGEAVITEDNGTLQLTASVSETYVASNVTWSVESGDEFVSVDQNGTVTSKNNGNGKAVIRATLADDPTKYDEIDVYVRVCEAQAEFFYDFNDFTSFPDPTKCWKSSHTQPIFGLEGTPDQAVKAYSWTIANADYYIVSPKVIIDGKNSFSFDTKLVQGPIKVQVGLLSDNNDYSTFMPIGSPISVQENSTYTVEVPKSDGYHYIAMKVIFAYNYSQVNFDNISWKNPLSVLEQNAVEISVYPNPVHDQLIINSTNEVDAYEVINLSGQTVLSGKGKTVEMSQLQPGVYMVKIHSQGQPEVVKRVIKK